MEWELLASPICRLNGLASTRCSAFLHSKRRIRTKSLPSMVSVSGKRDFAARDKSPKMATQPQVSRLWRSPKARTPRQFGAICEEPGNLRSAPSAWWWMHSPSNQSPLQNSLLYPQLRENPKTPLAKRRDLDFTERMIRPGFLYIELRQNLIELARDGSAADRLARRANALVLLDDGMSCEAIAKVRSPDDDTIRTWYRLYEEDGSRG